MRGITTNAHLTLSFFKHLEQIKFYKTLDPRPVHDFVISRNNYKNFQKYSYNRKKNPAHMSATFHVAKLLWWTKLAKKILMLG